MKKLLKAIVILIILLIIGMIIFFNLPKSNITKKDADFKMNTTMIYQAFNNNETAANKKYLGKVLELGGKIIDKSIDRRKASVIRLSQSNKSEVMITLAENQTEKLAKYSVGDQISIKAKCNGFIQEVVFDKGIIID